MSIEDVSQFNQFINGFIPGNKWVVSGSFAIDMWCVVLNIQLPDIMPNNIDILYAQMTPITISKYGSYIRKQTAPCSSVTYENPGFTPLNITMTRNNIKYFEFDNTRIMAPTSILAWYEDEPEKYQFKIDLLNEIISRTKEFEFKYINVKEPRRLDHQDNPAKRILLAIS